MGLTYCLNTSTIRSEGATILDAIDTAAEAGWDGLEPWVQELDEWVTGGGTLEQVRDRTCSETDRYLQFRGGGVWPPKTGALSIPTGKTGSS